ncbi:MAG: Calx-beta domain-containing protein, partial [Planctomycetota bacterium]
YNALPCNTGLWRLDRTQSPAEVKQIIHSPSGSFTPFVDSTGRVMFVQWDHLSRDVFASYDREVIGTAPQSFNGHGTFDSETGSSFTLGTAGTIATSNYTTFNFFPEPRNFDVPALTALGTFVQGGNTVPIFNGIAINHFFPWECREDGSSHETDRHVGRHELGGTSPLRPSYKDDDNLVNASFSHPTAVNFFHLAESPTSPGTFYAINSGESGTHTSGPIVSYVSTAALNPDNMAPTYITPALPNSAQPWTTQDVYRNPVPLANGSLLAAHSTMTQNDTNIGTAAAPLSRFAFRLRSLISNGTNMIPDSSITFTTPQNVTNIQYYAYGSLVTYTGAPLWELDPVEVVVRNKPAQLNSTIAAPEQAVFDAVGVHAPTYQAYLRANNLALVAGRDVTRRDAADKQQPYNLKVAWSNHQTLGAVIPSVTQKIYDVGWMQIFQADAIRAYTHNGQNPSALPAPGRRLMPTPLHGQAITEMPVTPGAPAGAVKIADDGSWAAVLPAGRALTWHMLDGAGTKSQVKERVEVTFAPGEVRSCAVCHGVNTHDQAGNLGVPSSQPQALSPLLQFWKTNHPPGAMQHAAPTTSVIKNALTAKVSVTRTGGSTGPVSVNYSTANGTALAGTDYMTVTGTLNWADGDTTAQDISIPILNNPTIAASKTLSVTLSNPLYGSLGATTVNTVTLAETPLNAWRYTNFGANANTPGIGLPTDDPDWDGQDNQSEFLAGTVPTNAQSVFSLKASLIGGQIHVTFTAQPNVSYTVQYKDTLTDPTWQKLSDVPATANSQAIDIVDAVAPSQRFYRAVTPQVP